MNINLGIGLELGLTGSGYIDPGGGGPPPGADSMLLETGFVFLLESGDSLLLE